MFNEQIRKYYDASAGENTGEMVGNAISQDIPIAGGLIGGGISLVSGLIQKNKAKKLLAQNPYPTEGIPNEVLANQQIAQGAATQGLPSEEYAQAQKNIQRNQAAQLSSAQTAPGGAVRNIGAIQQNSNDANANLTAQSAAMRQQNIGQLLGVNNQVASWRDKLFDWNSKTKYAQNYNYAMGLLGQGNQNVMAGIDKGLGTLTGAGASGLLGGGGGSGSSGGSGAAPPVGGTGYTPGLANTGGGSAPSPASAISTISTLAPLLL